LKKFFKNYWLLLLLAVVIIPLDQLTKYLVRTYIPVNGLWTPIQALPFFQIVHWQNDGVAFGMFQGIGWFFTILSFVVAAVIFYYFPRIKREDPFIRWALAIEFSGAIGNLIDRLVFGKVTDFVKVGGFAVWNIADASITIGVVLLLIGFVIQEVRDRRNQIEKRGRTDKRGNTQGDEMTKAGTSSSKK
jgi:signal peptidase II